MAKGVIAALVGGLSLLAQNVNGWQDWGGYGRSGYGYRLAHPAFLYWTGEMRLFSEKPLKVLTNGWKFAPRNGGKVFGFGIPWPLPLEGGFEYEFRLLYEIPPDFVAVGDCIVWRRGEAKPARGVTEMVFRYVKPVGESATEDIIWSVRNSSQEAIVLVQRFTQVVAQCRRRRFKGAPPTYERWRPPYPVRRSPALFRVFKRRMLPYSPPSGFAPRYPTARFRILQWDFWFKNDNPRQYFDILRREQIRGMWLIDARCVPLPEEQVRLAKECGVKFFYTNFCSPAMWNFDWKGAPNWKPAYESGIKVANYLTETFPDAEVFLRYTEDSCPDYVFKGEHYKAFAEADIFTRLEKIFDAYREWEREVKGKLLHPERCRIFSHDDGALFPAAYRYRMVDFPVYACIHRQNVNMLVANARGSARAYGKRWGVCFDPWCGVCAWTVHPEELRQIMLVWFFAGADFFFHELNFVNFLDREAKLLGLTQWGDAFFRTLRMLRCHPVRGEQVVRLGVVRGFGAMLGSIPCQQTGGEWSRLTNKGLIMTITPVEREDELSEKDYILMRAFFPKFGELERGTKIYSNPERWCTGTPFGPVDFVPWDASEEHLRKFKLLVYMGVNAMDEEQWRRLKGFVKQGGTLVLSVGHLLVRGAEPRSLFMTEDYPEVLGVRILTEWRGKGHENVPIRLDGPHVAEWKGKKCVVSDYYAVEVVSPHAEVVAKVEPTGDPLVVGHPFGKGKVWLFATRSLSRIRPLEVVENFLARLAEGAKMLEFIPPSDWLEYFVQTKGKSFILAVFNHGRGVFPSGNGVDHGAWRGEVCVNLENLGLGSRDLCVYRVRLPREKLGPVRLEPVEFEVVGDKLRFRLKVERFEEILIGPQETAKQDFFGERAS